MNCQNSFHSLLIRRKFSQTSSIPLASIGYICSSSNKGVWKYVAFSNSKVLERDLPSKMQQESMVVGCRNRHCLHSIKNQFLIKNNTFNSKSIFRYIYIVYTEPVG